MNYAPPSYDSSGESDNPRRFRLSVDRPRCLVEDCADAIVAELFAEDYNRVLEAMGVRPRHKRRIADDPPVYACARHTVDAALKVRLKQPRWQALLFAEGDKQ